MPEPYFVARRPEPVKAGCALQPSAMRGVAVRDIGKAKPDWRRAIVSDPLSRSAA